MSAIFNQRPKPVLLCILDGWGCATANEDDAITRANTPCWDRLMATYPNAILETSGEAVGLPAGQMGNSEVGHMNIGSGRVFLQELPLIDKAITSGELENKEPLLSQIALLKERNATCHLIGLISPGGVHSHQDHVLALAKIVSNEGVPVAIHAILDGRDSPPSSAEEYIAEFEKQIEPLANVAIATVSGRFYTMDRDQRWDRVELAYDTIVLGEGWRHESALDAIKLSYEQDKTDEFVVPAVIKPYIGMSDGDGLIMANFRTDRAREILDALVNPEFSGFERKKVINFISKVGMVEYSKELSQHVDILFKPHSFPNTLGEVISNEGLKQLRIAETEKYAHVTFFFNGGKEKPFAGEERILIPSPKVQTYDLKPEMSAPEVTDALLKAIEEGDFSLIVLNFANADMVGHTGDLEAATAAIEALDTCLDRISSAILEKKGVMLITADHGNAEQMIDQDTKEPHTAHTTNPVPLVIVGNDSEQISVTDGTLSDIGATILDMMDIEKPAEMNGSSLVSIPTET